MRTIKIILTSFLFIFSGFVCAGNSKKLLPTINEALKKKYPYSMLTPDYGIITEGDLAHYNKLYRMQPYGPDSDSLPYWICVPPKSVKKSYETWRNSDPWSGSNTPLVTLCFLSLEVRDSHWGTHKFYGRRSKYLSYCRDFIKNWNRLTRNEPIVCLSGESRGINIKLLNGKLERVREWTWDKFRTRKGCYSHFDNCEP